MAKPRRHLDARRLPAAMRLFATAVVLSLACAPAAAANSTLVRGRPLLANQTLLSQGGIFELGFFSVDGSGENYFLGIWYYGSPPNITTVVWVANRDRPITEDLLPQASLSLNDTSLVLAHPAGDVFWSSELRKRTSNYTVAAELHDNGNFAVPDMSDSAAPALWESFSSPTDKLLPGGRLGSDPRTGSEIKLTSWRSTDDAVPGDYELTKDLTTDRAFIISNTVDAGCCSQGCSINVPSYLVVNPVGDYMLEFNGSEEPPKLEYLMVSSGKVSLWRLESDGTGWSESVIAGDPNHSPLCTPSIFYNATIDAGGDRNKMLVIEVLLPLVVASLSILAVVVAFLSWRRRQNVDLDGFLSTYSYAQLKSTTRNFSSKLGEGGCGRVYAGALPSGALVAVKELKGLHFHGEKQFRAEVQTIGMVHHANLVRLHGFCSEGSKRLLVYEFMPNGSLGGRLFSGELSWSQRYRIAVGAARGLAYLHEGCKECIIHCDVKPENVLLDGDYSAKISDFGLAKLLHRDFSRALTTVRGTVGYLAPEWITGVPVTPKVDVYSFGMMLLEIVSGQRNAENANLGAHGYFPSLAAAKSADDDVLSLLDRQLAGKADADEVRTACRVACWCIQEDERQRPTMGQVVRMLQGDLSVAAPPVPRTLGFLLDVGDYQLRSSPEFRGHYPTFSESTEEERTLSSH